MDGNLKMEIEVAKERLRVAALLTMSGGFLDAFTFIGHGKIFANSMTGNIVLMAVSAAAGNWDQAIRHVFPLLGFTCALLAAHLLRVKASRYPVLPSIASLVFEIIFLVAAALIRWPELWLISGISFVATLQTVFFAQSRKLTYSSVMTTSNLRGAIQRCFESTMPRRNAEGLHDAGVLGAISFSFIVGALIGGFVTPHLHDTALYVPASFLFAALVSIGRPFHRQNSSSVES
jgi:uncharacterized membrane protein YoaK (UPF0700 family)